jgi:hypothetical protein
MTLVEFFLPLYDAQGDRFPSSLVETVQAELTARFGGVTAFTRSPAQGWWRAGGSVERDTVIACEVMVEVMDFAWWRGYIEGLERRFQQTEILARATQVCRI